MVFEKIAFDVMMMPTSTRGYRCICVARDDLSGWVEARAMRSPTSKAVAAFFFEEVIARHGHIRQVTTDNGSETQGAFTVLAKRYQLNHVRISEYNSRANGAVEKGHFVLREALVKMCDQAQEDVDTWPQFLHAALLADRTTTRRVTGYSPWYLLYGTEPTLPLDFVDATILGHRYRVGMSREELILARTRQLAKLPIDIAHAAKIKGNARRTAGERADDTSSRGRRLRTTPFKPGDLVLIRNTRVEKELNRKHKPRYIGPYIVLNETNPDGSSVPDKNGAIKLSEMDGTELKKRIAGFRLRKYHSRRNSAGMRDTIIDDEEGDVVEEEEDDEEEGEEDD